MFTELIILFIVITTSMSKKVFYQCNCNLPKFTAEVDLFTHIGEVDERFLSIGLDCSILKSRWDSGRFDLKSKRLRNMVRKLFPAYFRVGGHFCNFLIYKASWNHDTDTLDIDDFPDSYKQTEEFIKNAFIMNARDWKDLNGFAQRSWVKVLFQLNPWFRKNGEWDSSNVEPLFNLSKRKNYTKHQLYTLGSEPNSYGYTLNSPIPATNLSHDYHIAAQLLNSCSCGHIPLVGPCATQNQYTGPTYMKPFVQGADDVLDAAAWHQYYVNAKQTSVLDFLSPQVMDTLKTDIDRFKEAVHSVSPTKPIWLSETSTAYGGGANLLSNTYVAGFLWLDKLGMAAVEGIKVVIRHTLYGGRYNMITNQLYPLPDYWLSVLYKQLVGQKVLKLTDSDESGHLRAYAHCAEQNTRYNYSAGAVTVFGMNVHQWDVFLTLYQFINQPVEVFMLTPHADKGLTSSYVDLNGEKLEVRNDAWVPHLWPMKRESVDTFTLPSYSLFFFVFPNANVAACL